MSRVRLSDMILTTQDGQTVRLSVEDARDLHRQLDELFGASPRTTLPPLQPVVLPWPTVQPFEVTCTSRGTAE